MAKKKKRGVKKPKSAKKERRKNNFRRKSPKEKQELLGKKVKRRIWMVVLAVFAVLISLTFFGQAGEGGKAIFDGIKLFVGKTIFFLPLLLVIGAIIFYKPRKKKYYIPVFVSLFLFVLGISGLFESLSQGESPGGILGYLSSWIFLEYFGILVSSIVFSATIVIAFLIIWDFAPKKEKTKKEPESSREDLDKNKDKKEGEIPVIPTPSFEIKKVKEEQREKKSKEKEAEKNTKLSEEGGIKTRTTDETKEAEDYIPPPVELLSTSREKPSGGDTKEASEIIKKTLANFGISVKMGEINVGPTVTQYTLKPAEGIKLSKITGLANDLALSLAAHPIRIEAPIPGRSLVGVEVPNKTTATVLLRDLVEKERFQASPPLTLPLGKDVSGESLYVDLEKMPHMLVAGSTGSGKTIFLQSLISSFIMRNSPKIMRLILVDPKRVEFSVFSSIPHLLTPIIFDAQKTMNALSWLIGEMERRFEVLREVKTRNINSFNDVIRKDKKLGEKFGIMPYIVVIIDELADLMAARGREVEGGIVRLAQLARAVGIHLVVATQRPSVDVITGIIKANLPGRISFQVASQVDSRTVLDCQGAETLVGRGDMLFLSPDFAKPKRIQGCYTPQENVKKVISFIKEKSLPQDEEIEFEESLREQVESGEQAEKQSGFSEDMDDEMFEEAKDLVMETGKASASFLQRRLKVGYARAARLIDILEDRGIVGPAEGSKPREVYENSNNIDRGENEEMDSPANTPNNF